MNVKKIFALVAMLFAASASQAAIVTYTGNTSGSPTFNRPIEDLSGLSAVGTAVAYNAYTFSASTSGNYTFLTTGAFDTFAILYQAPFAAGAALTNSLIANDDLVNGFTTSGLAFGLTAGQLYTYIVTGFGNTDFGAFSTTIGGPGTVTPAAVPLPAAAWLLLSGIGAVGAIARRRRKTA